MHQAVLVDRQAKLKTKGDCIFEVVAPKLWNSLTLDLRSVDSVYTFKKHLNTKFCQLAFVLFFYFYCVSCRPVYMVYFSCETL